MGHNLSPHTQKMYGRSVPKDAAMQWRWGQKRHFQHRVLGEHGSIRISTLNQIKPIPPMNTVKTREDIRGSSPTIEVINRGHRADQLGPRNPYTKEKTISGGRLREQPQSKKTARAEPMLEKSMEIRRSKRSDSQPKKIKPGTDAPKLGLRIGPQIES